MARVCGYFDRIPVPFPGTEQFPGTGRSAMKYDSGGLLFAVDLARRLLFGIEGATAAIGGHLDVLGLTVLAFSTALGGNHSRSADRCGST